MPHDLKALIAECRERFGPVPRTFSRKDTAYLKIVPPKWCVQNEDPLLYLYTNQGKVREYGEIVWGHRVQANRLLYGPGSENCPADAVYSFDPYFESHVDELAEIAQKLFALKGTRPAERDAARIAQHLTAETSRCRQLPVPRNISGGREVFMTNLMVHREHLPQGYLSQSCFPLIVHRDNPTAALILPARYWPEELLGEGPDRGDSTRQAVSALGASELSAPRFQLDDDDDDDRRRASRHSQDDDDQAPYDDMEEVRDRRAGAGTGTGKILSRLFGIFGVCILAVGLTGLKIFVQNRARGARRAKVAQQQPVEQPPQPREMRQIPEPGNFPGLEPPPAAVPPVPGNPNPVFEQQRLQMDRVQREHMDRVQQMRQDMRKRHDDMRKRHEEDLQRHREVQDRMRKQLRP